MLLLSRVAERVYWMSRYLERVENTARLINIHTALLMDMPREMEVGWSTLLDVFDLGYAFNERYRERNESNVMDFLIASRNNPASLFNSLQHARENVRTTRDCLPESFWEIVNELKIHAEEHAEHAVRIRGPEAVVAPRSARHQAVVPEAVRAERLALAGVVVIRPPRGEVTPLMGADTDVAVLRDG